MGTNIIWGIIAAVVAAIVIGIVKSLIKDFHWKKKKREAYLQYVAKDNSASVDDF